MPKRPPSNVRDERLRNKPEGWVDPARKRGRRPRQTQPRLYASEPSRGHHKRPKESRLAPLLTPPETPTPLPTVVPRHARLGILFIALQQGIPKTSKDYDIPQSTLYAWFREEGGIEEVREFVATQATVAFQTLIQTTCLELGRRIAEAPTEELFLTFRKMIEVGEKSGVMRRAATQGGGSESGGSPSPTPGNQIVLQIMPPAQATQEVIEVTPETPATPDIFDE